MFIVLRFFVRGPFLPSVGSVGPQHMGFSVSSPCSAVDLGFDILTMDGVSSFPSCSLTDLTLVTGWDDRPSCTPRLFTVMTSTYVDT